MAPGKRLAKASSPLTTSTVTSVSQLVVMNERLLLTNVAVEIFISWLYTQRLPAKYSAWLKKDEPNPGTKAVQIAMLETWVFADRFLAPELCRDCEYALIDNVCHRSLPYYEVVISAFECLPSTSPVLKAMIAAHCERFDKDADNEDNREAKLRTQLPHDFLVGVMLQYMMIKEHGLDAMIDPCHYHDHPHSGWGGCTVSTPGCVNDIAYDSSTVKEPKPKPVEETDDGMGFGLFD